MDEVYDTENLYDDGIPDGIFGSLSDECLAALEEPLGEDVLRRWGLLTD